MGQGGNEVQEVAEAGSRRACSAVRSLDFIGRAIVSCGSERVMQSGLSFKRTF